MTQTIIVTVSIDSEGKPSAPSPVSMPKDQKNVKIHWQIDPSATNWYFTDCGIEFAPNDQFSDPKKAQNGKSFHWTNKNTNTVEYHYAILVTDNHHVRSIDPIIENDGKP